MNNNGCTPIPLLVLFLVLLTHESTALLHMVQFIRSLAIHPQLTHTGAEPVATALSFTLVLIHLNPEEGLKPLMSEIDEVLGKKKTITVDDLEKL